MRIAPIFLASLAVAACSDAPTSPAARTRTALPTHASGALITASVVDLGTLPGGTISEAFGVNEAALVVGYGRVPSTATTGYAERAFRWTSGGGMQELGTLSSEVGYDWARAAAVNDAGQIVGWSYAPSRYQRATMWTATGGPYDLGSLGSGGSLATAINASGQVAGFAQSAAGPLHAFLWTPDVPNATTGAMIDLGTLPGGTTSWATGLNDAGTVVGHGTTSGGANHAFIWTAGSGMVDLGTLGGTTSSAAAINAQGQVVGESETAAGGIHAFLWTPSAPGATTGTMLDLGVLAGTPGSSRAQAVNDLTQVVGVDNVASAAWRWSAADGMQDLGPATGTDRIAYAINENAQVAGALIPAGGAARHAALWTVSIAPPTTGPVAIGVDVAPGDGMNTISLRDSRDALVAVAVLTAPGFDAPRLVVPGSARIGSTPVASRKKGVLYAAPKDVDLDGDMDLVLHFERAQLMANGDLTAATTSLLLQTALTDGRRAEGRDAVRVIKK